MLVISCATALLAAAAPTPALASSAHHKAHHARVSRKKVPHTAPPTGNATPQARATVQQLPCANADLMPNPSNIAEIRAATLCLINRQRAQRGLRPLKDSGRLDIAAEQHSEDMVANNYFDHTEPTGVTFASRIMTSGYVPSGWAYMLGENIAMGTLQLATPAAIVNAWMTSPEHRANILADFQESGIGVVAQAPAEYAGGQPGATYTEDFGAIQPSS